MFIGRMKKMTAGSILAITLIAPPLAARAQAPFVPVFDGPNATINSTIAKFTGSLELKEYGLDQILYILQKQLIQVVTQSTISAINSAFNGNPVFVQNPLEELIKIAEKEAGDFIGNDLGDLPDIFRGGVQQSLARYVQNSIENPIRTSLPSSLDTEAEYDAFVSGDFSQGEWESWAALRRPNNNPYNAYLNAEAELSKRIATKKDVEETQWDWGDGFKSLTDGLGNILTPGKVIEGQLENVLGSGLRQLELADEINEIVGALATNLTTQLFSSGGLLGTSSPASSGTGSSYLDDLANETLSPTTTAPSASDLGLNFTGPTGSGSSSGGGGNNIAGFNHNFIASQSGTYLNFLARGAIDGRFEDFGGTRSTSITAFVPQAWWQVDMKREFAIDRVLVFRRLGTTIAGEIGTFRVFLSKNPFPDDFNPLNPPANSDDFIASPSIAYISEPEEVVFNAPGRYLRIQRVDAGANFLELADVEIYEAVAPTITLNGPSSLTLGKGDNYTEQGVTITDPNDPDPELVISGDVDEDTVGSYIITYTATNQAGAVSTITRSVNVVE